MNKKIHPLLKIYFLLISCGVALSGKIEFQIAHSIFCLCCIIGIEKKWDVFKKLFTFVLPIIALLIIVNFFLLHEWMFGVRYAIRFIVLTLPFFLVFYSTSPQEFMYGFRAVKFPHQFNYLFLSSLEILELLRDAFHTTILAQQLRGYLIEKSFLKRWRNFFPIFFPVFLNILNHSIEKSIILEFKGITSTTSKTYLTIWKFSLHDVLFFMVLTVWIGVVILY